MARLALLSLVVLALSAVACAAAVSEGEARLYAQALGMPPTAGRREAANAGAEAVDGAAAAEGREQRAAEALSPSDYSGCWVGYLNGEKGLFHFDIVQWGRFDGWAENYNGVTMRVLDGRIDSRGHMTWRTCPQACVDYDVLSSDAKSASGTAQVLGYVYTMTMTRC